MDLRRNGRILYISSVDVSVGNGPGVNEREFILALYAAVGDRAHFLIPQPMAEITDLPSQVCTFSLPHWRHHPLYFPAHVVSVIRHADELLSRRKFDLLLFRFDVLPLAPLYITKRHPIPYVAKTLGQGALNVLAEKGGWLGRSLEGVNRWLFKQLMARALVADSCSPIQVEYLPAKVFILLLL